MFPNQSPALAHSKACFRSSIPGRPRTTGRTCSWHQASRGQSGGPGAPAATGPVLCPHPGLPAPQSPVGTHPRPSYLSGTSLHPRLHTLSVSHKFPSKSCLSVSSSASSTSSVWGRGPRFPLLLVLWGIQPASSAVPGP